MTISQEQINEIRLKQATEPFIWIIDLFDASSNIVERLTNYTEAFTFQSNSYKPFPFIISIPEQSQDITQSLQMTFANFKTKEIENIKQKLYTAKKIIVHSVNVKFPDDNVFPASTFYFTNGDSINIDSRAIKITFSRRNLSDRSYPYRRFNSVDHPTLFEDFNESHSR